MIMTGGKKASTFPQLHGLGIPWDSTVRKRGPFQCSGMADRPPIDARLTFPPFPFHSRTPRWEPEPPCPGSYLNESFRDGFTHERQEPAASRRRSRKAALHRRSASFRREVPNRTGRSRKRFPGEWRKFFPGNGQERIHTFRGSCGLRRTGWDTAAP